MGGPAAGRVTDELFALDRPPAVLGPGAVHVPDWMDRRRQEFLVRACVEWTAARPPRTPVLPGGGRMSVRTTHLGRNWSPYRYDDDETAASEPLPDWLVRAARSALGEAAAVDPQVAAEHGWPLDPEAFTPDAALVNLYGRGASMGLHQDRDEASDAPVISLSLGDACTFRFGTPEHRGRPYTDVRLESGDLVVFGGRSRLAFHGVPKVFDGTAPAWCSEVLGAAPGRVNITLRQTRALTVGA